MITKLLIIDDNVDFVSALYDSLSPKVSVIDTAYTIQEAQNFLLENSYHAIILDINLNNQNGALIIKFISDNENPNKETPVIIISGIITAQFIETYKNRFAAILLKPIEPSELKNIIDDIFSKIPKEQETITPEKDEDFNPDLQFAGPFQVDALKEEVSRVMVNVKKNSKLKQLFKQASVDRNKDNYISSHIGMMINISAAICNKMEWNSEKTIEKFVYASYLHDLAIAQRPDLARINSFAKLDLIKETLSEEEYRIVLEHPNIAAKTVAELNEIPPDVDTMIRQHHEFGNETGFPTKCGYQKITPFAAVFIVSHCLADFIIENPKWTMEDFIKQNRSRLHGSHFTKIMKSLSELK